MQMKSNKLTIQIDKSVVEVFEYTTNPDNTHKWIEFVGKEEASEYPPKLGVIYRNRRMDADDKWDSYLVSEFEVDKLFTLSSNNSSYNVRYTYTSLSNDSCELEYYEWMDKGELENPFPQKAMDKLKQLLESK